MYTILTGYLERLPDALREKVLPSEKRFRNASYSPHSLRARSIKTQTGFRAIPSDEFVDGIFVGSAGMGGREHGRLLIAQVQVR
jgi:hypothetical protein